MNDMSHAPSDRSWKPGPVEYGAVWERELARVVHMYERRPVMTISIGVTAALVLFVITFGFRANYHPFVVAASIYFPAVMAAGVFAFGAWWVFARWKTTHRAKALVGASMLVSLAIVVVFGKAMHDHMSQYLRYKTLLRNTTELTEWAQTPTHLRLLPRNAVQSLVHEHINETETSSEPDYVRSGDKYRWTMAILPSQPWWRLFSNVDEVRSISADDPSPDLSHSNASRVNFSVAENLLFSRKTSTCVRLAFGPWRYLRYEPGNVFMIEDDAGRWVQAVSLIKWTGWIFPWPEFGGVQIIEQGQTNILGRTLLGCGRWIKPAEIKNHKYLVGQNLMPYEMTRSMAESFRFQAGFFAPLRWSREGDLRIADIAENMNQQPFTLHYRMPDGVEKLFQSFSLQPRDESKEGLTVSFYVPADGIGKNYVYWHAHRGESPLGPTAVPGQVRADRKMYDWEKNTPVEVRPFVRQLADEKGRVVTCKCWMTTVVTKKKLAEGVPLGFIPGGDPEIAIIESIRRRVVWVDPHHPETWDVKMREKFHYLWDDH